MNCELCGSWNWVEKFQISSQKLVIAYAAHGLDLSSIVLPEKVKLMKCNACDFEKFDCNFSTEELNSFYDQISKLHVYPDAKSRWEFHEVGRWREQRFANSAVQRYLRERDCIDEDNSRVG